MDVTHALPRGAPLTYDDLQAMPDDGHRYELVDGVLIVTPAPVRLHQRAVARLLALLMAAAGVVLLAGVAVSYVRTALLILFAFAALELARRRRFVVAAALAATLVVLAGILVVQSQGTESRTFVNSNGSAAITLNGRTSAWRSATATTTSRPRRKAASTARSTRASTWNRSASTARATSRRQPGPASGSASI